MRHLLMDPAFPDIVGEWANEIIEEAEPPFDHANDNLDALVDDLSDDRLTVLVEREVAATRFW